MRFFGLILAASLAAAALAAAGAPDAAACLGFRHDAAMGPVCPAPGGWIILLRDGSTVFTHGPDAFPAVDPAGDAAPPPAAPRCAGDGEARIEVLYAVPVDRPDNRSAAAPGIRDAVAAANGVFRFEAAALGATLDLRVLCEAGEVAVGRVVLSTPAGATTDSSVISDLRAQGFERPAAKYLVYVDAPFHPRGGTGTLYEDDRPGPDNLNNRATGYALVQLGGPPQVLATVHELGHALGAVQPGAPHSSGGYHCTDGEDYLCYDDAGGSSVPALPACADRRWLDCGHDDYFHPAPAEGSYLATHWNLASPANRFVRVALAGEEAAPEPAQPLPAQAAADPDARLAQGLVDSAMDHGGPGLVLAAPLVVGRRRLVSAGRRVATRLRGPPA